MFGGGASAAKIADIGFSQGSFLSPSRLSRDGRKNSRKEAPKSRFYRDGIACPNILQGLPPNMHLDKRSISNDKGAIRINVRIAPLRSMPLEGIIA